MKTIRLFGYDLFGKRAKPAPIHLPDEDEALYAGRRREERGDGASTSTDETSQPYTTTTTATSSMFDLDAAPLSPTAISALASTDPAALLRAAEEARLAEERAKEERRARRRARKEAKALKEIEAQRAKLERMKEAGVLPEDGNGEVFEGFQGSGSAIPNPSLLRLGGGSRSASRTGSTSTESGSVTGSGVSGGAKAQGRKGSETALGVPAPASTSSTSSNGRKRSGSVNPTSSAYPTPASSNTLSPPPEEVSFTQFVKAGLASFIPSMEPSLGEAEEDGEDEVDLDGGVYAAKAKRGAWPGGSRREGGSESRGSGSYTRGSDVQRGSEVYAHTQTSGSGSGQQAREHRRHGSVRSSGTDPLSAASHPTSPFAQGFAPVNPLLPPPTRKKTHSSSSSISTSTSGGSGRSKSKSRKSTGRAGSVSAVPSPLTPNFAATQQEAKYIGGGTVEQGLGFFDEEDLLPAHRVAGGVTSPPVSPFVPDRERESPRREAFPSTGFGARASRPRDTRDVKRFLQGEGDGL